MNLANKITSIRLVLVPFFVILVTPMPKWLMNQSTMFHFIGTYNLEIATLIFIIGAITDKLDGYIARKYNQVTNLGCFLDPLADKLLVISALLFLVEENKVAGWIVLIIIGREIAVTWLRFIAAINNKVLSADKFGKIKLVFQVITIPLFLMSNFVLYHIRILPFANIMMFLTVLITIYSGINYFVNNKEIFYENGKIII